MADVRALLKAKREQRIEHPFATYNGTQLRCSACGTAVKHSSAWEGHLGTKAHRNNVSRLKAEEEKKKKLGKRKADVDEQIVDVGTIKKRRVDDLDDDDDEEDAGGAPSSKSPPSGFPANFFSDPSRAPPPLPDDDYSDAEDGDIVSASTSNPIVTSDPVTSLDAEWEAFQRTVLNPPRRPPDGDAYSRATIVVEPELVEELPAGFPVSVMDDRVESAGGIGATAVPAQGGDVAEQSVPVESEEEARRRKEREEKELIMDRLLDEERAQEEADEKVNTLKARLELVKRKRGEARLAKKKTQESKVSTSAKKGVDSRPP